MKPHKHAEFQSLDQSPDTTKMIERNWQGLTMEDIAELRLKGAYSLSDRDAFAVDAKLKEKNS